MRWNAQTHRADDLLGERLKIFDCGQRSPVRVLSARGGSFHTVSQ